MGGRQTLLQIAGTREDGTFADLVIGQPRDLAGIELRLPGQLLLSETIAEQRMHVMALQQALAFAGGRHPAWRALPGVGRQVDEATGHREQTSEIHRAGEQQAAAQVLQRFQAIMAALQTGQHLSRRRLVTARLEDIIQIAAQNRMGTDLDQQTMTAKVRLAGGLPADQTRDGGLELHRLTDVLPPVAGVQAFAFDHAAGDGGEEGNVGGAGRQPFERGEQAVLDRVHRRAVEGIVEPQHAGEGALCGKLGTQGLEPFAVAGQRGAARAVDASQ